MTRYLLLPVFLFGMAADAAAEDWPRWAGPRGDFTVEAGALAEVWPEGGPPRLWQRPLGAGYSAILAAGGRLFTMYRDGEADVLIALDPKTGATLWQDRDVAPPWPDATRSFGLGPNSTPLALAGKVIGIGGSGRLRALDAATGQVAWRRDLPADFGRRRRQEEYGYSANPLPYDGKILVLTGGDAAAVVALDPKDGAVVWRSAPGGVSYGQPYLGRLAGRDQFVYFEPEGVVALDPKTGRTLWKHPIEYDNGNHLTPPVRCDENHLWVSSQFDTGGGRLLELKAAASLVGVTEKFFSTKLDASHWTLHCHGDYLYGSIGSNRSSRLSAIRWRTGEVAWQEPGFHKAQSLWVDGKLLLLDESGKLALARVSPARLEVLATAQVAAPKAWTLPTLVGTTLFVRDQENLQALDLAKRP